MAFLPKQTTDLLRSFGALLLITGAMCMTGCNADGGGRCSPTNNLALAQAASSGTCPAIEIMGTEMTSLEGLEQMKTPAFVAVNSNDRLTDISAANGARRLSLTRGAPLGSVELEVKNGLSVIETTVDSLSITFDPIERREEEVERFFHFFSADLGVLALACAEGAEEPCDFSARVDAKLEQTEVSVDGIATTELFVEAPISAHAFLHPFGLPEAVMVEELLYRTAEVPEPSPTQDHTVLQEYRAWLDSQGFTGPMEYCVAIAHRDRTCEPVGVE